ncbi:hypothetical protein FPQ18DRAFT_375462 [Pyronema domesticum]|nr:hypothetical protein FPQ18DRAFT_375462 [Pyronema domesticum]
MYSRLYLEGEFYSGDPVKRLTGGGVCRVDSRDTISPPEPSKRNAEDCIRTESRCPYVWYRFRRTSMIIIDDKWIQISEAKAMSFTSEQTAIRRRQKRQGLDIKNKKYDEGGENSGGAGMCKKEWQDKRLHFHVPPTVRRPTAAVHGWKQDEKVPNHLFCDSHIRPSPKILGSHPKYRQFGSDRSLPSCRRRPHVKLMVEDCYDPFMIAGIPISYMHHLIAIALPFAHSHVQKYVMIPPIMVTQIWKIPSCQLSEGRSRSVSSKNSKQQTPEVTEVKRQKPTNKFNV